MKNKPKFSPSRWWDGYDVGHAAGEKIADTKVSAIIRILDAKSTELARLTEEVARLRLAIRFAARHLSTPEYLAQCKCEPCREAAAFHAVVKEISNVG